MSNGFTKFQGGVNHVPQNTQAPAAKGDVRYNSSSDKLEVFDGAVDSMVVETKAATLSNKTLDNTTVETIKDSNLSVQNAADATKVAKFDSSAITTGTTRTYTLPDVTDTLVTRTSVDQLANRLKNKDLEDNSVVIVNSIDTSKKFAFNNVGMPASTSTTLIPQGDALLTLPLGTQTMVGRDTIDSLTQKQLSFSVVSDGTLTGAAVTLLTPSKGVYRLTTSSGLTGVAGIPAGTAGQLLILENKMTNSFLLLNESASATAANRILTGTGNNIRIAQDASISFVYDQFASRWQVIGGVGASASNSFTKNYLSTYNNNPGNGDFEIGSTAGWSLGTTGTLTNGLPTGTPTFGSGTTNLAITAVSSGQLGGSYSMSYASTTATTAGNMVASSAFAIDIEDQAKVLTWKIYYKAQTNPGNANWSGTSSNSFGIAIWDATNSVWLGTSAAFGMAQSSGVGYATGTFQTGSTTAALNFIIYNVNATTGAITLYFDDISVSPLTAPLGAIITDPVQYTPTFSAAFGTVSNVSVWSWREGSNLIVNGRFQCGTTTAASASISLGFNGANNNVNIDFTRSPSAGNQMGYAYTSNAGATGPFSVSVLNSSASPTLGFFGVQTSTTSAGSLGNASAFASTSANILFFIKVPIVGWSSNVQLSSDTDTRVISFSGTQTSQAVTANTTNVAFTAAIDRAGAWTGTTYVIPVSGDYIVTATGVSSAVNSTFQAWINAVAGPYMGAAAPAVSTSFGGSAILAGLKAGDIISFRSSVTTTITVGNVGIFRLSGPSVIAATESINAAYTSSSSQAITNSDTVIVYGNKEFDSHNAYNTSTGVYTVPASGKYRVTAAYSTGGGSTAVNEYYVKVRKNSSIVAQGVQQRLTAIASTAAPQISRLISCLAGDTIDVVIQADSSGQTVQPGTAYAYFCLERVGN